MQRFLDLTTPTRTTPTRTSRASSWSCSPSASTTPLAPSETSREAARALTGFTLRLRHQGLRTTPADTTTASRRSWARPAGSKPPMSSPSRSTTPNTRRTSATSCGVLHAASLSARDAQEGGGRLQDVRHADPAGAADHPDPPRALMADLSEPDQGQTTLRCVRGGHAAKNQPVHHHGQLDLDARRHGLAPVLPSPNVSGWEQDEAWLTTASVRARYQAASQTVRALQIKDGTISREAVTRPGAVTRCA